MTRSRAWTSEPKVGTGEPCIGRDLCRNRTARFVRVRHVFHDISRGFTLIELLLVISIVGILAGIAIPTYQGYLEGKRVDIAIADI